MGQTLRKAEPWQLGLGMVVVGGSAAAVVAHLYQKKRSSSTTCTMSNAASPPLTSPTPEVDLIPEKRKPTKPSAQLKIATPLAAVAKVVEARKAAAGGGSFEPLPVTVLSGFLGAGKTTTVSVSSSQASPPRVRLCCIALTLCTRILCW